MDTVWAQYIKHNVHYNGTGKYAIITTIVLILD